MKPKNKDKTHCPKGHPYSGDNLYVTSEGGRKCKQCKKDAAMKSISGKRSDYQSRTV